MSGLQLIFCFEGQVEHLPIELSAVLFDELAEVGRVVLKQLSGAAVVDDLAVSERQDLVVLHDRVQAMHYRQDGRVGELRLYQLLDGLVGFRVDAGCGFVH